MKQFRRYGQPTESCAGPFREGPVYYAGSLFLLVETGQKPPFLFPKRPVLGRSRHPSGKGETIRQRGAYVVLHG